MARGPEHTLIQFLVTMAFVIMVAIFNWLKRRSSDETTDLPPQRQIPPAPSPTHRTGPSAPAPTAQRPQPRRTNWQEELRRMLAEESETPPLHEPLPRLPSPPPLISIPPAPVPPRSIVRPVVVEPERGLPVELAGLTVSGRSYQQASQLDEQVAARLRGIGQQVQRHAIVPQIQAGSRDISRALTLIRTRNSLRSVIMASVILGPPKALERS